MTAPVTRLSREFSDPEATATEWEETRRFWRKQSCSGSPPLGPTGDPRHTDRGRVAGWGDLVLHGEGRRSSPTCRQTREWC